MALDGKLPPLPPNFRDPLERDTPKPINVVVTPTAAIPGAGYNEL
jgi:hypothetical protein